MCQESRLPSNHSLDYQSEMQITRLNSLLLISSASYEGLHMISFTSFRYTDFYSFFNLTEMQREKMDSLHCIHLKPGGFQTHIDIEVMINEDEYLLNGVLTLDREWIGDASSINVFAKDITKSFIHDLLEGGDQQEARPIMDALIAVRGSHDTVITLGNEDHPAVQEVSVPELSLLVRAFTGEQPSWSYQTANTLISLDNITENEQKKLRVSIQYKP
jgi:hypothetical protein